MLWKNSKNDQWREWVKILQEKFALADEEAEELYAITRTCFAHNFEESKVKCVIKNYLAGLGRITQSAEMDANSVFTYRAGTRRYEKWSWQENAFGVLAYLLTVFFFSIDIISSNWHPETVARYQFYGVLGVLILWSILDMAFRGRPCASVLFTAINRFMPGLTVIMYFLFHVFKWRFAATGVIWWLYGMIAVVGIYTLLSAWFAYAKIREYRKVENLATKDENAKEETCKSNS